MASNRKNKNFKRNHSKLKNRTRKNSRSRWKKVGVYQDENGKLYAIKPVCSHLGCELKWNNLEKTWDCPCHGSRFSYTGKSIYDPSIEDLETIEIE